MAQGRLLDDFAELAQVTQTIWAGKETIPKIGGIWYWFVLGICILKDIIDVGLVALELFLVATVLAIPIAILIFLYQFVATVGMFMLNFAFFRAQEAHFVGAKKFIMRRLLALSVGLLMKLIPLVAALPTTAIIFVLLVLYENRVRMGGKIGAVLEVVAERVAIYQGKQFGSIMASMKGRIA